RSGSPTSARVAARRIFETDIKVVVPAPMPSYRKRGRTFSISARLGTSGKSFTAGFGIDWKIRLTHPNKVKGAFSQHAAPRRPMIHFIKFYQIML
ncbi:MAG TPA: hypothetical protein VF772_20275, partial [Terriglobales bacterium]